MQEDWILIKDFRLCWFWFAFLLIMLTGTTIEFCWWDPGSVLISPGDTALYICTHISFLWTLLAKAFMHLSSENPSRCFVCRMLTIGMWNLYFLTLISSPKVSALTYKWLIYQALFLWWIVRKVRCTEYMTAGDWGHGRDRAVTECLSSSANTACVDISRRTVVHRGGPGGHGNLHMSFWCSFIQWFLSKRSKQIVVKADRTRPVTQRRTSERLVVKYNSDLLICRIYLIAMPHPVD